MDNFENEIKSEFLTEARELLSGTEQCFLSLERNPSDIENLNLLFRLAHNLKGSSGAVGFADLTDFTHKLESLLLELKEGRINVTPKIVDLLLRSNDYLLETIERLQSDLNADCKNPSLQAEVIAALEHPDEAIVAKDPVPTVAPSVSHEPPQELTIAPRQEAAATHASQSRGKDENIRVSLSRIEKLLNNVGELSILQAVMLQQSYNPDVVMPALMRDTLNSMSKIIKETQSVSMSLRMLPIKQTFQKMERIVRDTSRALGKDVVLHLSGEDTEIDKTVLEQIADPLVHIIRNAVDHGLENTEERKSLGKSAEGHVHLSASHRAGHVVIEVRDDGKGLRPEKLVAKARERGLLREDETLPDDQALQLIFAPGFSTKENVTDVSGRGVGMDVVKTNISALQGHIEIDTKPDQGTTFKIYLPLTLAIVDCVVIRSGAERYVVPLAQISEFYRPRAEDLTAVHDGSEILTIREAPMTVVRLSQLIGYPKTKQSSSDLIALVVTDTTNRSVAVLVDQILSQQQIVIKPLGRETKGRTGIMGSAILGDGRPSLILDLFELTKTNNKNISNRKLSEAA
ncbi:MAG: chemotaxis protein CheA [Bdellovibrionales bacterium]|jgi:two-component system chemotaxis sensor kinase CheA|nr:chemotaxis protein CheA [Bdellovibrionales bacterium]